MKRAVLCLALLGLGNCAFAQKHQAVTIGIVAGTVAWGTCEMNIDSQKTCGIIGGSAALVLGWITALVTLLANTNEQQQPDPYLQDENNRTYENVTAPPPGLPQGPPGMPVDAGVPPVPVPADAAAGDAM